jgi:CDP-glucose 4,6-dehydratase
MENMVDIKEFFNNRNVFITGHTGFKGAWLCNWLRLLNAKIHGYSLSPTLHSNVYQQTHLNKHLCSETLGNIQNIELLKKRLTQANPDVIFHLAAQPLVNIGYSNPVNTFHTNILGTVNLFEAVKVLNKDVTIINITTDKVYYNNDTHTAFSETSRLGGFDPYAGSKACVELLSETYYNSYLKDLGIKLINCRAGNVIGGGDYTLGRLLPDINHAYKNKTNLIVRHPDSVRPWQHVLEPISVYLKLAAKVANLKGSKFDHFNIGPTQDECVTVRNILDLVRDTIDTFSWELSIDHTFHEAKFLSLDCKKIREYLPYSATWGLERGVKETIDWYLGDTKKDDMEKLTFDQINRFSNGII